MAGAGVGTAPEGTAGCRSRLERVLRLFGDVRPGDGPMVVLLAFEVFLLLTSYYLLKTVREPLILLTDIGAIEGSELKTYGTAAQALVLLGFVPLYARAAARTDRWRLVRGTLLTFAGSLALFIALGLAGVPIGPPFYVWLGIISLLQVAQFWSLANDLYDRKRGERLFGIIAVGGSLGAIAGAQLAQRLIQPLGIYPLMAIAAAVYLLALYFIHHLERLHGERPVAKAVPEPAVPDKAWTRKGAFRLVLRDRYLLLLGVMLLLANLVNTQGEYILGDTIRAHAEKLPEDVRAAYVGRFYGGFYSVVNGVSLLIQALLVARLFRHVGVRSMLFVLPAAALAGYVTIAIVPILAVVSIAKGVENSLDYSLQNTLRQALFLPTSREAKYAGKATIDTTFVRLGDTLAAGVVFVGVHVLALSRAGFALVNTTLVLAWILVGVYIARRHRELSGDASGPARTDARRSFRPPARVAPGLAAVAICSSVSLASCASAPEASSPLRPFPDRAVAWHENDDRHVPAPPRPNKLSKLGTTLLVRDSLAYEVEYYLGLDRRVPAQDVNALDEVPCSTWFCPRNHRRPMTPAAVAAGPAGDPPVLPLRITGGKGKGAGLGFEVKDAVGRKFLLKLDPAGHLGMASTAEIVGGRIFHAAGYNVPSSFVVDLAPGQLLVDPGATYKHFEVKEKPLTPALVEQILAGVAVHGDGRVHAVAVTWLEGEILGAFDMIGRRADDPNDRIPHEDRRSLRASWMLAAWLSIIDASAMNTLDSYVEADGRRFVRHHFIDFGAGLGSASDRVKGPHEGQEYVIEVGRSVGAFAGLGFFRRRPYERLRATWEREVAVHPTVGWYQAEGFDPDHFRTNRKVPSHRRMTDRDAYWGAKIVTSFSDAQLDAIVTEAGIGEAEGDYLARALRVRRDIIGRRYLRAMTAVESPELASDGRALCFEDLAIARGFARPEEVRYRAEVRDRTGRLLEGAPATVPARGARTCLALPEDRREHDRYRVVEVIGRYGERQAKAARVHLVRQRVAGLERDE